MTFHFRTDEIAKIVDEIGDGKFQIPSAPFPFSLLWFQVDGFSNGRINLKIVEAPDDCRRN
jgi:hypothetical protein